MTIKELYKDELHESLSLVRKVFMEFEAPDYSQEGIDEFFKSVYDEKYLSMLSGFGAYDDEKLVGIIATRNEGTHIALFFVDGQYHRQGIGKKLFQTVVSACPSDKITVNSSPFAVEVYHRLGFRDMNTEQRVNGIRFTPMEYNK